MDYANIIYVYNVHIHSCCATYSSSDLLLYKEISREEYLKLSKSLEHEESTRFGFCNVYVKDKTYYNVRNLMYQASEKELEVVAQKYYNQGFSKEKSTLYAFRYNNKVETEEKERCEKRHKEGYIFYNRVGWEYNQKEAQGGFSNSFWQYKYTQDYTKNFCFGYLGHSVRKAELDMILERALVETNSESNVVGVTDNEILYSYLSSSDARHFADSLEGYTFEEQNKMVEKSAHRMWNKAFIYSRQEHNGTWESSKELEEKYKDTLFKE